MNNFKKIGLTALAASLVSVSAHAGALTASGSASMNSEGHTGENLDAGTTFSMANSVTFTGGGELDNGLSVSVSFELDQGAANNSTNGFDNHSVTVSSDALGSLTLAGHGGSTSSSKIDTTAAGDMWDNFDQLTNNGGFTFPDAIKTEGGANNSFFYSSPDLMDGLNVTLSYNPSAGNAAGGTSETGFGFNYTGVEGLSFSYAETDVETGVAADSGTNTVYSASYAYGPVTVSYSNSEEDPATTSLSGESTSYAISYTVSDSISLTYGSETHEQTNQATDIEIDGIKASYTSGGMTISAAMMDGENLDYSTNSGADVEYWALGASFAF